MLQISNVDIDNCLLSRTRPGGGLYAQSHANQASSDLQVLNTVFQSNAAATNGGGAFVGTTVTTTFADVDFLENSAGGNGGAVNMGEHATGTANFERVLVSSNTAGGDSGGIHLYRSAAPSWIRRSRTTRRGPGGALVGTRARKDLIGRRLTSKRRSRAAVRSGRTWRRSGCAVGAPPTRTPA